MANIEDDRRTGENKRHLPEKGLLLLAVVVLKNSHWVLWESVLEFHGVGEGDSVGISVGIISVGVLVGVSVIVGAGGKVGVVRTLLSKIGQRK
jgi:glucose dehydrogenase